MDGLDCDLRREREEGDAGLSQSSLGPAPDSTFEVYVARAFKHGELPDGDDGDKDAMADRGFVEAVLDLWSETLGGHLVAQPDMGIEEEELLTHLVWSTRG